MCFESDRKRQYLLVDVMSGGRLKRNAIALLALSVIGGGTGLTLRTFPHSNQHGHITDGKRTENGNLPSSSAPDRCRPSFARQFFGRIAWGRISRATFEHKETTAEDMANIDFTVII